MTPMTRVLLLVAPAARGLELEEAEALLKAGQTGYSRGSAPPKPLEEPEEIRVLKYKRDAKPDETGILYVEPEPGETIEEATAKGRAAAKAGMAARAARGGHDVDDLLRSTGSFNVRSTHDEL